MNSKKLITLLVLTTMLIAMVPMVPVANAALFADTIIVDNDDTIDIEDSKGEKGNLIIVKGGANQVASGYEVSIYWDKIQSWDGVKGHLNTTEADSKGGFEIWFDVPEAPVGNHYLWFTATDQETKISKVFVVIPDCDLSSSSGLAGSKPLVDLWGFGKNKDVAMLFIESDEGTPAAPIPYTDWYNYDVTSEVVAKVPAGDYATTPKAFSHVLKYDYVAVASIAVTFDGITLTYDGTNWSIDLLALFTASYVASTRTLIVTMNKVATPAGDITVAYSGSANYNIPMHEIDTIVADEFDYDGTLDKTPVMPGTVVFLVGDNSVPVNDIGDDITGKGNLWCESTGSWVNVGGINYVTGEWSLDIETTGETTGPIKANYDYIGVLNSRVHILISATQLNDLGSIENRRVTIPPTVGEGEYFVVGMDAKNNRAYDGYEIGAVITISIDEGAVGDKIEISGEGFPPSIEVKAYLDKGATLGPECHIIGSAGINTGKDKTNIDGEFEFDIIVPGATKKDDDYKIRITGGTYTAKASFEITGLASISADPEFGPQGSGITVSGKNFQNIKDSKVKITLLHDVLGEVATIKDNVKVDADGSFKVTCTVPTENDGTYDMVVTALADTDGAFHIDDDVEFRIGTIMVLLSKDESVVGDRIVLTGNGFTATGEWNATFGDITIFEEERCTNGLLKVGSDTPQFFVPQVQPGEYTIIVWDIDAEISVETDFTVTDYTVLEFELYEAPNEFTLDISGWNWPEVDGTLNSEDEIDFVLFNETDKWDMDLKQLWDHDDDPDTDKIERTVAKLNETGFLNDAMWIVPDSDTLDKGKYWVNATIETDNGQEYFMQLEFVIGDIHMYSAPRKATFRIGETVSFKIQHTFGNDPNNQINSGDIKVYDPDGELYWDGDPLDTWSKVGTWYECPTSSQVASGNPMVLLDDAPLGTWTYKWRESDGDVIAEGVFNVETSEADIFGARIDDLNQAIDDLTSDISAVTDAVAGVQSNVQSAIQASNAAVDAANKAIEAVNAVAGTASEAATAANKAAEAAGKAQKSASDLSTLVYGAIGASLVAALAAIVSLMQISKRIAG